jgi:hypothetical protein
VLRVDSGAATSKPPSPAAPAFGGQLAARLAGATDPDVLAALQSRTVDQRVLATLAVIAATQPVRVEEISTIDGEEGTGAPRRDITLSGPRHRLQGMAGFFERQVGPFAVQSVDLAADGLRVRFPLRTKDIGLGAGLAPVQGGPAALRVADLRRSRPAEQLNFVRIDGTAVGSLETSDDANPSDYRSMPAGTYVVVTNRAGGGDPVIRQVLTLHPGVTYTLALFSAAESSGVAVQLAPDGPPTGPTPDSAVRMLHAASAAGSVYLALVAPGAVEPIVLANQAGYGLITGYAALPAGQYEAVVSANGREWRQPVEFLGGEPTSLLLTDGPDGPVLRTLRDVPDAPAALNPPTLTMPATGSAVEKTTAKTPAVEGSDGRRIAVVLCVVAIMGAAVLMARARPAPRREVVRPPRREVVRRARPIDKAVRPSVPPRRPRLPNDAALHVVRRARPVDDTARLDFDADKTARIPIGAVTHSVPPRRLVRRARSVDDTARLPAVAVKRSVPRVPR